ncbi:MAG: hypothetical protein ACOX4G_00200 [Limnochordia bacterium]|jgi:hypothetical protein
MEAYEEARHLLAAAHKDLRALKAMFDKDEYPRTHSVVGSLVDVT